MRLSMMVARSTPDSTARRQASILGRMPDSRVGISRPQFGGVDLLDDALRIGPVRVQPGHIGQHDQAIGTQRGRQRRSGSGVRR